MPLPHVVIRDALRARIAAREAVLDLAIRGAAIAARSCCRHRRPRCRRAGRCRSVGPASGVTFEPLPPPPPLSGCAPPPPPPPHAIIPRASANAAACFIDHPLYESSTERARWMIADHVRQPLPRQRTIPADSPTTNRGWLPARYPNFRRRFATPFVTGRARFRARRRGCWSASTVAATSQTLTFCGMCCGQLLSHAATVNTITCSGFAA